MERTQNEIINALEVIKDTCDTHYSSYLCKTCPLRTVNNDCGLMEDSPINWNINKPDNWRAF